MSNFIRSNLPNEGNPINLEHVISFGKDNAGSTTRIVFYTSDGGKFLWKYYSNKANRDLDYEKIMQIIFGTSTL